MASHSAWDDSEISKNSVIPSAVRILSKTLVILILLVVPFLYVSEVAAFSGDNSAVGAIVKEEKVSLLDKGSR